MRMRTVERGHRAIFRGQGRTNTDHGSEPRGAVCVDRCRLFSIVEKIGPADKALIRAAMVLSTRSAIL